MVIPIGHPWLKARLDGILRAYWDVTLNPARFEILRFALERGTGFPGASLS